MTKKVKSESWECVDFTYFEQKSERNRIKNIWREEFLKK